MKEKELSDILAECLDAIEKGERTHEECLAQYSRHRDELIALLGAASKVSERAGYAPRPSFRLSSQARLLRRLPPRQPATQRKPQKSLPLFRRWVQVWTTTLVLIVSLLGVGTVYASTGTLPGDTLYPVKLTIEDARLLFADDTEDIALASEFALRRLEEIQSLIDANRAEDLDLAVSLFSNRITTASDSLEAVAQTDPERAAELGLTLEQALSRNTEQLNQQLETVPAAAKPAIENAIHASQRGQETVHQLIGGPSENIPGPINSPDGGPPEETPVSNPPGGGRPDEIPGNNNSNPPGVPPTWVPGGSP